MIISCFEEEEAELEDPELIALNIADREKKINYRIIDYVKSL